MSSPLYKKFQLLDSALTKGDINSAHALLCELRKEKLSPAAQELFKSLNQKFFSASGEEITYESAVISPESRLKPKFEDNDNLLSNHDDRPLLDGISLVSSCMNRNDNLKKSIISWLKLPVQEIVIVDWNSLTPVTYTLAEIIDPRIKIIRVENEPDWILTYAVNVGLRFSSFTKIYKLDADIQTQENFLDLNQFEEGEFIRGTWESAIEEEQPDQVYINGSFGCYKSDLVKVGFYNEHIRTYGWDDSDLYFRLSTKAGLRQKHLAFNSLKHLHQEQEERLRHQRLPKNEFLNRFPATEVSNSCNKYTIALYDQWWPSFLQDYSIKALNENHWVCNRTTDHREIPGIVREDARRYAVIENSFRADPVWAEKIFWNPWMAELIYEDYCNGIPFVETAARLLLEGSAEGCFSAGISPYAVLKTMFNQASGMQSEPQRHLLVFEGVTKRFELTLAGHEFVISGLESSHFQALKNTHISNVSNDLFVTMDTADCPYKADSRASERVLVISLYDESNEKRVIEYLECLKRNLRFFDAVVIFYERSDGSLFDHTIELVSSLDTNFDSKLIWTEIDNRPTFEEMFTAIDSIFPGSVAVTSNADIAFDQSIFKLGDIDLQGSFLVLSRQEIPEYTDGNGGHIMNHFGLPNTWSADAWIYQSPRTSEFKADFPIGTFHCDSFLNYYIGKSDYKIYNPCLSINALHFHDEYFNSSEFKRLDQAELIAESLNREMDFCDGEEPIGGVQWCRIGDIVHPERANQLIKWSNFIINIFVDDDGKNLVSSLLIASMCLKIASHIEGRSNISLNIPANIVSTKLGDLLFVALQVFDNPDLNIAIANPGQKRPFVEGPRSCHKASVSIKSLLDTYLASFPGSSETALFDTDIRFDEVDGDRIIVFTPHASIYFEDHVSNDLHTYLLSKVLKQDQFEQVQTIISTLSEDYGTLQPIAEEFAIASQRHKDHSVLRLRNELWNSKASRKNVPFELTFITSIYKGVMFFRDFLENIAAAAIECNAEVILVDAASPENEKEIFASFIEEYPGLERRFRYISLEDDPGLYNCWKLAIRESSTEFVGNANLDDRRSPYQAAALLDAIKSTPGASGAASAIRATSTPNPTWYGLTDNDYWFCDENSDVIEFDSLYFRTENNEVCSRNMMHCMPIWHRSLHQRHGFFDEERYGTSADWAFWLECAQKGEKFKLLPDVLSLYFKSDSSHNRIHDSEGEKELRIIKDYFDIERQHFIQQ